MSKKSVRKSTSAQGYYTNVYIGDQTIRPFNLPSSLLRSDPAVDQHGMLIKPVQSNCFHWKTTKFFTGPGYPDGSWVFNNLPADPNLCNNALTRAYVQGRTLLTEDLFEDFSGLEFIKELPGVASLFNPKSYLTYSGYGQAKWGLQPFIRDVKALLRVCQSYMESTRSGILVKKLQRNKKINIDILATANSRRERFVGESLYNGEVRVDGLDLGNIIYHCKFLLDQLRINPDLLTAWELTPYSFVADYYVPISDMLKALVPRGYNDYAGRFIGSWSLKGTFYNYIAPQYGRDADTSNKGLLGEGTVYIRQYIDNGVTFGVGKQDVPLKGLLNEPTVQNYVDTLYVASQLPFVRKTKQFVDRRINNTSVPNTPGTPGLPSTNVRSKSDLVL